MSKLTVKACVHTINSFGFNQNEGKTSLTLKNNYYCEASMMKNVFLVFPF